MSSSNSKKNTPFSVGKGGRILSCVLQMLCEIFVLIFMLDLRPQDPAKEKDPFGKSNDKTENGKGRQIKSGSRQTLVGTVVKVVMEKQMGFIARLPVRTVQESDRHTAKSNFSRTCEINQIEEKKEDDVYFHFDRLKFALLVPKVGDEVTYVLGFKDRASDVRPVSLVGRTQADIKEYVSFIARRMVEDGSTAGVMLRVDAVLDIFASKSVWRLVLDSPIDDQTAQTILNITLQLCDAKGYRELCSGILNCFGGSKFLAPKGPMCRLLSGLAGKQASDLADRFLFCWITSPRSSAAVDLLPLFSSLCTTSDSMVDTRICQRVNQHLLALLKSSHRCQMDTASLTWCELPLVPGTAELLSPVGESLKTLSSVKATGAYTSVREYLDTYFRLLRFDCFADLSQGIQAIMAGTFPRTTLNTYRDVILDGFQLLENGAGLGLMVRVKPNQPPKDWSTSSHLRFGNLVCISSAGDFQEPLWAVVGDRGLDRLKREQIVTVALELCSQYNSVSDAKAVCMLLGSKTTIMAESPTYYRAYEPVLRALQLQDENLLPFKEVLVHANFARNAVCNLHDSSCLSSPKIDNSATIRLDSLVDAGLVLNVTKVLEDGLVSDLGNEKRSIYNNANFFAHENDPLPGFGSTIQTAASTWSPHTQCQKLTENVLKYIIRDPGVTNTKEVQEYNMAYAHFLRLVGTQSKARVTQIDVNENPTLEKQFADEKRRMIMAGILSEETWIFHGSGSNDNVESIMCQGFKVGGKEVPIANGSAHGHGVYSATTPDTPMAYGRTTNQVILARALRGRPDDDSWQPRSDWVVFRSGRQLLPQYVIHFENCIVQNHQISVDESKSSKPTIKTLLHCIAEIECRPAINIAGYTDLDRGQLKAVRVALQNQVALIQGPPGTGKTFIGIKIIELLRSISTFPCRRPILVLTYKNHALDEFLVGCMEKLGEESVVRVGGRSLEKKLEGRNLSILKRSIHFNSALAGAIHLARNELEDAKTAVKREWEEFRRTGYKFRASELLDYAKDDQIEHLLSECRWQQVASKPGQPFLSANDIKTMLTRVPEGFTLRNFLRQKNNLSQDAEDSKITAALYDALERAVASWHPPTRAFTILRCPTVESPPLEMKNRVESTADPKVVETEEIDEREFQEEEPERQASEEPLRWKEDESVKLDGKTVKPDAAYEDVDVSSVCTEYVMAELLRYTELWRLNATQRACLICIWLRKAKEQRQVSFNSAVQKFAEARKTLNELYETHEADILRQCPVIGMTITGASLKSSVLAQAQPVVVIVEEAAEVLESQILACIGPWVERLIMIGDHMQLRPQVNCYELVRRHKFDISMFERLINNGMQHGSLSTQNRMRPEFVTMLRDLYPLLQSNHTRVDRNPTPTCVAKSMWFWSHTDQETPGRSYTNTGECERVVALALFFVQQGYLPSQITVLAAYRGQTRLLKDALRRRLHDVYEPRDQIIGNRSALMDGAVVKEEDLECMEVDESKTLMQRNKDSGIQDMSKQRLIEEIFRKPNPQKDEVAVYTIDQFQGDENDIIIISLVRSNGHGDIGFLRSQNRYCVAVSRARCGVYFVGNAEALSKNSKHWGNLCDIMRRNAHGGIGPAIPLHCSQHPSKQCWARSPEAIKLPRGFCEVRCTFKMPCGRHECGLLCHADRGQHKICKHNVSVRGKCGHSTFQPCFRCDKDFECQHPCPRTLDCGHPCPYRCGVPCALECVVCIETLKEKQRQEEENILNLFGELLCKQKSRSIYPEYWKLAADSNQRPEEGSKKYYIHDVTSACLQRIQDLIDKSCKYEVTGQGQQQQTQANDGKLKVIKVERVENAGLWRRYQLRYTELLKDRQLLVGMGHGEYSTQLQKQPVKSSLGRGWQKEAQLDRIIREHYLFHGTSAALASCIMADGFEERVARLRGLYGAGVYFAENAYKSDQYSKQVPSGHNVLFIARVCLGAYVLDAYSHRPETRILEEVPATSHTSNQTPQTSSGSGVRYSALLGLAGMHREFVVYNGSQAYPEYLVHYERVSVGPS